MPYSKFFPITVFIAAQAMFMMIIESPLGFLSWIAFQAWAMYFLAGGTPKMGAKTLAGYLGGAVASVAIMELAKALGDWGVGGKWSLYLAVFVVVIFVISAEQVPGLDFVPSWFIGAGVFFGLMNLDTFAEGATAWDMYLQSGEKLMWAALVGLVFGAVTVIFRTWYEQRFVTPAAAPAAGTATKEALGV
jgi:hypothetical protein